MRAIRMWTMAVAAGAVLTGAAASAQNCAGFDDVLASSAFCSSVEWMKNREVTTGCGGPFYCPDAPVSRLAMAAFMKRLGTALTPKQVRGNDAPTGTIDLDVNAVVCHTPDEAIAGYPRRAYVDLAFTTTATADVGYAADLVASFDGGANWTALNAVSNRGFVAANQWSGLADLGFGDLAVGQNVRWGVRVTRGGVAGTADLADARCLLRVLIMNRDGTVSPF